MPSLAHVAVRLPCPACEGPATNLLAISWGYCPGSTVRDEHLYRVGDAIRWRACRDGSIPPWTFFGPSECNAGDPSYQDLVVRDHWLTGQTHECLVRLGGAAIEIRGGVIRRAWVYLPGELEDDDATIYLLDSEGEMVSMWDWEHHPMARVSSADCGELRLVPSVA